MQPVLCLKNAFKMKYKAYSRDEIKSFRKMLGLSVSAFGDLFFASKDTVKGWESGRRTPSCSSMRIMQFVEAYAKDMHKDINHRIRQAYK